MQVSITCTVWPASVVVGLLVARVRRPASAAAQNDGQPLTVAGRIELVLALEQLLAARRLAERHRGVVHVERAGQRRQWSYSSGCSRR